jgi:gamma-glutamylcyclotransferase
LSNTVFYFAYGSNTDPERFKARVGEWRSRRRARLPDHSLRFARMVQSEGGGGAVVDPSRGSYVDGVLFEITAEQLAAMDREEFDPARDVAATGKRIQRTVETEEGPLEAELYTVADDDGFSAPSDTYLGHILRGLAAAGHDETTLAGVRAAAAKAAEADLPGDGCA